MEGRKRENDEKDTHVAATVLAAAQEEITAKKSAADTAEKNAREQIRQATGQTIPTDDDIARALRQKDVCERLVLCNEEIVNAVIGRYLEELCGSASVPVVRGFASLSPLRKPHTLQEAKDIVDGR